MPAPYTCPKCKAPRKFRVEADLVDDVRCKCAACGYEGSAYEVDMSEWETVNFGRRAAKKETR